MADPLMSCRNLVVGYAGKGVLPRITLDLGRGEFWAVVGRNGSGKSTWFRTMLGLLPPVQGEMLGRGARVAYVPQRNGFDELWPLTVTEVVSLALERGWSFLRPGARSGVAEALAEVGATDLAHRTFRSLSEGQKQRVLLARVVAARAEVVFLDEPTAAMDPVAEDEAIESLEELRTKLGVTIVVVSHSLHVAQQNADHVLFVDRIDQVVSVATAAELAAHPVFCRQYGRHAEVKNV
jgi:zinc transport system ATP-binding protein